MEQPLQLSEFGKVWGRCADLFNVLDVGVLAVRDGASFSVLSARLTLRHMAERPRISVLQRPDWFALRQWRDIHDMHELLRRAEQGASWNTLFNKQAAPLNFSERPKGWFSNGFTSIKAERTDARGQLFQAGASWNNLFKTHADFHDWENEVNTSDEVHDIASMVAQFGLGQPCRAANEARQLHIELEFPLFYAGAQHDSRLTRLNFTSTRSIFSGWKVKWKSDSSSGVETLQDGPGDSAVATIAGRHSNLTFTPVFENQALSEFRVQGETAAAPSSRPHVHNLGDERAFMRAAIAEAHKSKMEPEKSPQLFVGAVIVKDGEIIARGHRGQHRLGEHAEFTALQRNLPAPGAAANATLYCTLEPCIVRNHPKRPCADWIKQHRITRVVIGVVDPNPTIRGGGIKELRRAGIDVQLFPAELASELEALNQEFERAHTYPEPSVLEAPSQTRSHELPIQIIGDETWAAREADASTLQTRLLRIVLIEAARLAQEGDLPGCLLHVAASYEALRIHWQRTYRVAVGSDAPMLEMRLPLTQSPAAARLFPSLPWLAHEPRLAEDKHGPAALAELGFPLGQRAVMRRLVGALDPFPPPANLATDTPTEADLTAAHRALVAQIRRLETDEPDVMETIEVRPPAWPAVILPGDELEAALAVTLKDVGALAPMGLAFFALDGQAEASSDERDRAEETRSVRAISEYAETNGYTFYDSESLCAVLLPQANVDAAKLWAEGLRGKLPADGLAPHLTLGLAIVTARAEPFEVIAFARRLLADAQRDGQRVEIRVFSDPVQ